MSLIRFAGRAMLASYFVTEGIKAVTKPDEQVEAAEPIARRVVPLAQKAAPAQYAAYVPQETRTLVQATGVAQVLGGLAFAFGFGRRAGATALAASMLPHVGASVTSKATNSEERRANRAKLMRNVALLGATLLAANDTEGQPSLGWRASNASRRLARSADKQGKAISKDAEKLNRKAKKELKKARKQIGSAVSH
ncbi:DoxX family protein [Aestuariimicrobium sp. p3-SID1156]|uniref:DoxX family protein n=1 Tax=Aestuariimicrobium sp. p3-SID1156 TaxID=2916038 RepID=UPI00223B20F8|nr:DoxX family protein [Aestuariimicrobium sp. p3-SID1156]MCT1459416.1 DoxX family protein [Aestuariimicrobium sp. p3-SID1156]